MYHYSAQEDQIILKYYGSVSMDELMKMLPDRTEYAIRNRVRRLRGTMRRKRSMGPRKLNGMPEVRRELLDSYTNELYINFIRYVEQARHLTSEQKTKADINHMIRVFRDIHGRFATEKESQLEEREMALL